MLLECHVASRPPSDALPRRDGAKFLCSVFSVSGLTSKLVSPSLGKDGGSEPLRAPEESPVLFPWGPCWFQQAPCWTAPSSPALPPRRAERRGHPRPHGPSLTSPAASRPGETSLRAGAPCLPACPPRSLRASAALLTEGGSTVDSCQQPGLTWLCPWLLSWGVLSPA